MLLCRAGLQPKQFPLGLRVWGQPCPPGKTWTGLGLDNGELRTSCGDPWAVTSLVEMPFPVFPKKPHSSPLSPLLDWEFSRRGFGD